MPDRYIQLPTRRYSEEIDDHRVRIITPDPLPPSPRIRRNSREFDIHFGGLSLFKSNSKKKKEKEFHIRRETPVVVVNEPRQPSFYVPPPTPDPPESGYYFPQHPYPPPGPPPPPPLPQHYPLPYREPSPEIVEIRPRRRLTSAGMSEQNPPVTHIREHVRQRARTPSPPRRNDPNRHVNRERDLRRQAQIRERQAVMERERRKMWEQEAIKADTERMRAEGEAEAIRQQLQRERREAEEERERERELDERIRRLQRQIDDGRAQVERLGFADRIRHGPDIRELERRGRIDTDVLAQVERERAIIRRDADRRARLEAERHLEPRRREDLLVPRRRDPPRVTQETMRPESMSERGDRVMAQAREAAQRRHEAAMYGLEQQRGRGMERRGSGRGRGRGTERIVLDDDHRRRGARHA